MSEAKEKLLLGIDTGGTYTDAVLFSDHAGVIAKAKSLTTKHDLSIGIAGAVDGVLRQANCAPADIALASMSTTLATNALVEGKGSSVGLVMIGFDQRDAEKAGLKTSLGADPVVFIPGGHNVHGSENPLDLEPLKEFVATQRHNVSGFAVAGLFAVRNASHEMAVQDFLELETGLPVTCSHELSSKLGGPKRALTTLLNARLIPTIRDLVASTRNHLKNSSISAPLMVVRGDGALVSADFALKRPIETILSGPAASLVGAKFLLGAEDALVSDIGGTTTDIAILDKGWPRIDPEGAEVGGMRTMVEAVAMRTFGLGGDSEVSIDEDNKNTGLRLGPRRVIPVSLLAVEYGEIVYSDLKRQKGIEFPGNHSARFIARLPRASLQGMSLKTTEQKLFEKLTDTPQAADTLLTNSSEVGTIQRLVSRGIAYVSGFTPSDAMHVLGLQSNWDAEAAKLAASVFCRLRDRKGNFIAKTPEELSGRVKDQLTLQSCDAILGTCMAEDGVSVGPGASVLLNRALNGEEGLVRFKLSLDRMLVGLGASAASYYPAIGEKLGSQCCVPEHADVANAIGAVAGEVRIQRQVLVTSTDGGNSFNLFTEGGTRVFADEALAIGEARSSLSRIVEALALEAGADDPLINADVQIDAPEVDGSRHFVEARIIVTATGRPRFVLI